MCLKLLLMLSRRLNHLWLWQHLVVSQLTVNVTHACAHKYATLPPSSGHNPACFTKRHYGSTVSFFLNGCIDQIKSGWVCVCVCVRDFYDSRQKQPRPRTRKIKAKVACCRPQYNQCIEKWCRNQEFRQTYIHNLNTTVTARFVFVTEFRFHIYKYKPDVM